MLHTRCGNLPSWPVSFPLRRLRSATRGIKSMFLRHARAGRLAAAYLLFTVATVMVPKADISDTLFDEANTPTNEMVVQKAASSWEYRQSVTAFVPRIFAQPRRISVRRILFWRGLINQWCMARTWA